MTSPRVGASSRSLSVGSFDPDRQIPPAGGASSRGVVKECRNCGRNHTLDEWWTLPLVGHMDDGEELLEMRNCICRSTISIIIAYMIGCSSAAGTSRQVEIVDPGDDGGPAAADAAQE